MKRNEEISACIMGGGLKSVMLSGFAAQLELKLNTKEESGVSSDTSTRVRPQIHHLSIRGIELAV